ncbi:MAG TPA: hypothetical protein PL007_01735 [Thermomonas sp.]|jgi:hypothetical protein|nr:hypothetical protein [Thermomonas sp.]HQY49069.1 hypothetical protein [Thermomonas sp.]HRA56225.1 hypothetical protein [Thermomonas sp.]
MRLPRYLLHRPSGFTFRLVVPKHLRRNFDGRGEIRRSLRTHDPRLALAWSGALLLAYHAAIARVEKTGNLLTQNGPAAPSQKAFITALKAWGIAPRGKGRMGLHSFRATVIQTMTRKGVAQGWRERFVGHESSEGPSTLDTDHAATYGAGGSALQATAAACLPALIRQGLPM